jgi:hypothetical protein
VNAKCGQLGPEFEDILEFYFSQVHVQVNAESSLRLVLLLRGTEYFCTTVVHIGVVSKVHETFHRAMTPALDDFSNC